MGPPNSLNGSCPIGHQLPLDPAPYPRKVQTCDNLKLAEWKSRLYVHKSRSLMSVSHIHTSSSCLHIVLLTAILISFYHTFVGLPRDFSLSLPNKILYAYLKRKWTCFFHILVNLPVVSSSGMGAVSMSAALVITDTVID
jgi:hypothetical protein